MSFLRNLIFIASFSTLLACGQGIGLQGTLKGFPEQGTFSGPPVSCDSTTTVSQVDGLWQLTLMDSAGELVQMDVEIGSGVARFTLRCEISDLTVVSGTYEIPANVGVADVTFQQNREEMLEAFDQGVACRGQTLAGPFTYSFSGNCLLLQQAGQSFYLVQQ